MIGTPQIVVPMTVITIQTSLTPIMAARDLSMFDLLIFAFMNDGVTSPFDVTIETGEAADAIDDEVRPTLTVPPAASGIAGQRSLILGPSQVRSFFRASGIASGGSPISARWILRGARRAVLAPPGLR